MIFVDAYFDYLGGNDYNIQSRNLYKELLENKKLKDEFEKWNTNQLGFLEQHNYFTESAKKLRDGRKQKTIDHLKNRSTNH